jgi:hypothetical protein
MSMSDVDVDVDHYSRGELWIISFSQQQSNQESQPIKIRFAAEGGRVLPHRSLFLGRGSAGVDPGATTGAAEEAFPEGGVQRGKDADFDGHGRPLIRCSSLHEAATASGTPTQTAGAFCAAVPQCLSSGETFRIFRAAAMQGSTPIDVIALQS